jgi:multidrug efflux system outer membrane protein
MPSETRVAAGAQPAPRTRLRLRLAAAAAACAVGPDYRAPQPATPVAFANAGAPYATQPAVPAFWREFRDPELESLVLRALESNHDLRIADARLAQVRALRREARLDLAPTITSGATFERARYSRDTGARAGAVRELETYSAGFDASWELDLFGRVRRGIEAQTGEAGAAAAERRAVSVAVASEVARNYFELRGLQLRREVATRNLENLQATEQLTRVRLDAGRGTELDVARARAQLSATLATLPELDSALTAARYRLAVLTGQAPTALDAALGTAQPLPELPAVVAVDTPERWLRRRPDIVRAERELAAATARIGVAVGDLFPRVTFVGRWGVDAGSFDGLGDAGADGFTLLPGIQWAAFDLGRVRARIAAREAEADAALASYERTVLTALEETDGALNAYRNALVRRQALADATSASVDAARLARMRYDEGVADFLAVLDAERTRLAAEDRLAAAQSDAGVRLVAVYKALGAGWDAGEAPVVRRAAP